MVDDYYEITAPAATEPLTLIEAKSWLRVSNTADDTLITALITGARQFLEKYTNRIFVETDIDCYFSGLNYSNSENYAFIQIRRAPLMQIDSVEVYSGGAYAATTDYELKPTNGFSRLLFINGIDADNDIVYPLKISASFGYSTMPEDLKTALKMQIAFQYENRGDTVEDGKISMPLQVKSILMSKYRILNTYG